MQKRLKRLRSTRKQKESSSVRSSPPRAGVSSNGIDNLLTFPYTSTTFMIETKKKEEESQPAGGEKSVSKRPDLKVGMTVRVHQTIKDVNAKGEEKERVQVFEGIIIGKHKKTEAGATVTIRKVSNGIGVEKIFPVDLPTIVKWEPVKQAKVRRAKIGFVRKYTKRLKEVRA